jgi:hypothetical protein
MLINLGADPTIMQGEGVSACRCRALASQRRCKGRRCWMPMRLLLSSGRLQVLQLSALHKARMLRDAGTVAALCSSDSQLMEKANAVSGRDLPPSAAAMGLEHQAAAVGDEAGDLLAAAGGTDPWEHGGGVLGLSACLLQLSGCHYRPAAPAAMGTAGHQPRMQLDGDGSLPAARSGRIACIQPPLQAWMPSGACSGRR